MAIREILEVPDPRLKQISAPVEAFDEDLRTLVADMFDTMYDAPGIGLAAIQVGVPLRVLVIDLQPEDENAEPEHCHDHGCGHSHRPSIREPRVFINPEILDPSEDQTIYQEGCLSVPEIYADVKRPRASARAGRIWTARPTRKPSTACWPPASSTRWTTSKASCSSTTSRASSARWRSRSSTSCARPPEGPPQQTRKARRFGGFFVALWRLAELRDSPDCPTFPLCSEMEAVWARLFS
jgi:peptide deformylase